jgi:hypothetical protein
MEQGISAGDNEWHDESGCHFGLMKEIIKMLNKNRHMDLLF